MTEVEEQVRPTAQPPQSTPPVTAEPPKRSFFREHPIKATIGLLILVGAIVGALWYWQYSQTFENTDDAQIDGHLNTVSSRIAGTITKVYVQENQEVQAGQLLVELDPRDYEVSMQRAQAGLSQAQAQVQAAAPAVPMSAESTATGVATARAEIATVQAGVAAAEQSYRAQLAKVAREEANNQRAQSDLKRYSELVQKDEVSRLEYDQRVGAAKAAEASLESERASADAAQRTIEQRKAELTQAQAKLHEAEANAPREVSIQRANTAFRSASADAAHAAVAEARLNVEYTKIFAPVSGVVGRKAAEIGMRVQPGQQLLSIVPLNDIWVTANFKETQLRRMKTGQSATIHVDALDRDFDGYVESMPAATAARYSILPPENASGNYVKVVQRLPVRLRFKNPESAHGLLRPGMSVTPKVWLP